MADSQDRIAPPYRLIAKLLTQGKVVPFLGAGVNFGMRQKGEKWDDTTKNRLLPSGGELSHFLADEVNFPSTEDYERTDLAKVASYYTTMVKREELCEILTEVFDHDFVPCEIHKYLAEIAREGNPMLIVTTNYDDLLERAFDEANRPYCVVFYPTNKAWEGSVMLWKQGESEPEPVKTNELAGKINPEEMTVIYKMHGTVGRRFKSGYDSYVITEDDYVDFLVRMMSASSTPVPPAIQQYFHDRYFLFLGYGLRDWNLRVVLRSLENALPGHSSDPEERMAWAIQYQPSRLERKLWNKRDIEIFDVDIDEFVTGLRSRTK